MDRLPAKQSASRKLLKIRCRERVGEGVERKPLGCWNCGVKFGEEQIQPASFFLTDNELFGVRIQSRHRLRRHCLRSRRHGKTHELEENADCLLWLDEEERRHWESLLAARTDKAGNFDRRLSAGATTHEILRSSDRLESSTWLGRLRATLASRPVWLLESRSTRNILNDSLHGTWWKPFVRPFTRFWRLSAFWMKAKRNRFRFAEGPRIAFNRYFARSWVSIFQSKWSWFDSIRTIYTCHI